MKQFIALCITSLMDSSHMGLSLMDADGFEYEIFKPYKRLKVQGRESDVCISVAQQSRGGLTLADGSVIHSDGSIEPGLMLRNII